LIVQTSALAISVIPVRWWAEERLANRAAALSIAVSYLLYPPLAFANLSDFHGIALAAPFLSFSTYYLLRRDYAPALCLLTLALLCREDVAFIAIAFGLYLIFAHRKRLMGSLIAVGGALGGYWLIKMVIPYFQGGNTYHFVNRYAYLGGSLDEIVHTALMRPLCVLERVLDQEKLEFLICLFLPVGLLPFLGFATLTLALPTLGYLLPSEGTPLIGTHYAAPLIPFIFYACIEGMAWFVERYGRGRSLLLRALTVFLLLTSGLSYYFHSTGPLARAFDKREYTISPHTVLGRQLMSEIPARASVSAQTHLVPHLSRREKIFMYPKISGAGYVLLDTKGNLYPCRARLEYDKKLQRLRSDPRYELTFEGDGYLLFRKRKMPTLEHHLEVDLGGQIVLLSYALEKLTLKAGDILPLTVYWRASKKIQKNYTVLIHLVGEDERIWGQGDQQPTGPLFPTSEWEPDKTVVGNYALLVEANAPPSEYKIYVGMYLLETMERLPIFDEDGKRLPEDRILLDERIRVKE